MNIIKKPKIILIGAGNFGKQHLRVLKGLQSEKKIELLAVIVNSQKSQKKIEQEYKVKTYTKFPLKLLKTADAIDIVTPPSTHYAIAKKCLKYTNVFVEKPLCLTWQEAKKLANYAQKQQKKLVIGHIYRFNPAVEKLKNIIKKNIEKLYFIEGKHLGESRPNEDCGAIITYLHHFDILDYLFGRLPNSVYAQTANPIKPTSKFEDEAKILLNYGDFSAFIHVGWVGTKKLRTLDLYFSDMEIFCDLILQSITIFRTAGKTETIKIKTIEPLKLELESFVDVISGKKTDYSGGLIAQNVITIADKAKRSALSNKVVSF